MFHIYLYLLHTALFWIDILILIFCLPILPFITRCLPWT
jgi:hypothetical protein